MQIFFSSMYSICFRCASELVQARRLNLRIPKVGALSLNRLRMRKVTLVQPICANTARATTMRYTYISIFCIPKAKWEVRMQQIKVRSKGATPFSGVEILTLCFFELFCLDEAAWDNLSKTVCINKAGKLGDYR